MVGLRSRKNPEGKEASPELDALPVNHSWVEEVGLVCECMHLSLTSPNNRIAEAVNIWGETGDFLLGWFFNRVIV